MTVLERAGAVARRLPGGLTKIRAGRLVAAGWAAAGGDAVAWATLQDGSRLRLDARGRTEAGAFWTGRYDPDLTGVLVGIGRAFGSVLYDLGANVGLVAVPAGRALAAPVVCFEPIPENASRLREALAANGLHPASRVFEVALGATEGEADMAVEARWGASTGNAVLHARPVRGSRTVRVAVRRLDDLVAEHRLPEPGVVKLDVEGAEVGVLRGAQLLLRRARPVVAGEFNAQLMPGFGTTFLDVPPLLPPDYAILAFRSAREVIRRHPVAALGNVLCVPEEKLPRLPLVVLPGVE